MKMRIFIFSTMLLIQVNPLIALSNFTTEIMSAVSQSLWESREEITGYPIYVRPCSEYFKELILESSDVSEEIKDYVINVRQNYKQWCDAVDNKIQATKLDLLKNLTQSIEIFLPISSKIETGYQRILKTLKDRNCYDKQIVQHYENELKNSINFINAVIFDRSTEAVSMVNGDMLLAFATPLRSTIIKSESTVKNVQEIEEIFMETVTQYYDVALEYTSNWMKNGITRIFARAKIYIEKFIAKMIIKAKTIQC